MPAILANTSCYWTLWSIVELENWQFNPTAQVMVDTKPILVISSIGLAGEEIPSPAWRGHQLVVNDRWEIILHSAAEQIGWNTSRFNAAKWLRRRTFVEWRSRSL